MDYALDENIDTGLEIVDKAAVEFGYTQRLTMVGLGASTANVTIQLASNASGIPNRFSVSQIDLINDGTGYTVPPLIGIATAPSGFTNATAVAIMTSRTGQVGSSIDRIEITNPGYGYTTIPTITIRSQNAFGLGGIATAIISKGSVAAPTILDPGKSYTAPPTVTINPVGLDTSIGIGSTALAVAYVNTLGELNAIRFTNAGTGYTVAPTITVAAPILAGLSTGDYLFKEQVTGKLTGTTAEVANWDRDERVLKVTNIAGSGFAVGESVVGIGTTQNGSDSEYKIFSKSGDDEYDPYGENIVVESEADAIIDFSEDNPFGDF